MQPHPISVITDAGVSGVIQPEDWLLGVAQEEVLVTFVNGTAVYVPATMLEAQSDGSYRIALTPSQLIELGIMTERDMGNETIRDEVVIPIVEETVDVQVQRTVQGRVRIHKKVTTREKQIAETLYDEQVQVERRPINQEVEGPIAVRYEGDTMIIPVMEEQLVIQKRYILKEEIHVTQVRTTREEKQTITLRRDDVVVERLAPHQSSDNQDIAQEGTTQ